MVFPQNKYIRAIAGFVVQHIPNSTVELKNTVVLHNNRVSRIDYLKHSFTSRRGRKTKNTMKFKLSVVATAYSNWPCQPVPGELPLVVLESLKLDFKFSVNHATGTLTEIKLKLISDDFRLSIFKLAKIFLHEIDDMINDTLHRQPSQNPDPASSESESDGERKFKRALKTAHLFYSNIEEISILAQEVQVLEMPFLTTNSNNSFKDYISHLFPSTSLDLSVKSINLNASKMSKQSAGFHALFSDNEDNPLNFSNSLQLLRLKYCRTSQIDDYISKKTTEILNIPNHSLNFKGNIFDQLTKGEGFKNSIAEVFWASSSPILDIDSVVLSSVFYNFIVIRKYLKLKKIEKRYQDLVNKIVSEDPDESSDAETTFTYQSSGKQQGSNFRTRVTKYLQDYYPNLEIKFIIEQPRVIIRHTNTLTSRVELLNFSYSSLNFALNTTENRDYHSICQILHPCVTYIRKSLWARESHDNFKHEVLAWKSFNATLEILKNLRLKIFLEFSDFNIDLANFYVIAGIGDILTNLTNMAASDLNAGSINLQLNSYLTKYKQLLAGSPRIHTFAKASSTEERIFAPLPEWLISLKVSLHSASIIVGSRSVLIPPDILCKVDQGSLSSDFLSSGKEGDLRCTRVRLEDACYSIHNNSYEGESLRSDSSSSTASSETLASNNSSLYWSFDMSYRNFELDVMVEFSGKYSRVIHIPESSIQFNSDQTKDHQNVFSIEGVVESLYTNIGYSNIAVMVGSIYLARQTLLMPIKLIRSKVRKDIKRFASFDSSERHVKHTSLMSFVQTDIKIKQTEILFSLNDVYRLRVDLFQTRLRIDHKHLRLHNKFLRLLTESPTLENYWSRLICWDDLDFKMSFDDLSRLYVSSNFIQIIHPHKHVIYKLFDSISITLKIIKHLVRSLKEDSDHSGIVHPSEMRPRPFPTIEFHSKKLKFMMEDDPFESELGMIYQLGLVEQRKRLDYLDLFDAKVETTKTPEDEIPSKLEDLEKILSDSWIRKVKEYKRTLNNEIVHNKKFLFGNEAKLETKFQKGIQPYSIHAPLMTILMEQVNLTISPPHFSLDKLPKYLNEIGKGIPLDSRYSLLIPTFMDLRLNELRMHLRDYPLPLLFVPRNTKSRGSASVRMAGHLVIAEALVTAKENMRKIDTSLLGKTSAPNKYYELQLEKILSSVKLFTDMDVDFMSEYPARFVWGQSYQFGIQQVMLNFDQFSKPPIDPSTKLGFWDKLRLIIHGNFKIRCGKGPEDGPLEVAFKGSRDPYDIFTRGSGFNLSFSDNILWTINEDGDPRQFCVVKSEKVSFYIPNYASTKLVCWSRDSSHGVFLPKSDNFVTSCHGYYLDETAFESDKRDFLEQEKSVVEKMAVSLSGGVLFRVGFVLERPDEEGNLTEECKPHYDINLFNPKYCSEGHDSYAGFRSDNINMIISLEANQSESYNTIHLSPGVFSQFFPWWSLFAGNMQLPIRRGKMFGELKKSLKFSQHLKSNRFIFNLKSLFISHVYRDEEEVNSDDVLKFFGLRGKMDHFAVDLHQRREQRIEVNKELDRNKEIKKMNFHIGDVHLKGIDLRLIFAKLRSNLYSGQGTDDGQSKLSVFDDDKQWLDSRDFVEAFKPSFFTGQSSIQVQPLMYSNRFSYLRDTDSKARFEEKDIFYNETKASDLSKDLLESQQRVFLDRIDQLKEHLKTSKSKKEPIDGLKSRIQSLESELSQLNTVGDNFLTSSDNGEHDSMKFHNKFFLIKMMLKWNNKIRNLFFKYLHFVQLEKYYKTYLSYKSVGAIEDLIEQNKDMLGDNVSELSSAIRQLKKHRSKDSRVAMNSSDRVKEFDDIIRSVNDNESINEDYLVYIESPQIQMQAEEQPDSVLLFATPSITAKVVSVYEKSADRMMLGIDELENRFGIMVKDANVLVLDKRETEKSNSFIFDHFCYGSTKNWPPWLGVEICRNSRLTKKENLLIENMCGMVTYYEMKPLSGNMSKIDTDDSEEEEEAPDSIKNKLRVDIPSVVVNSTASQYYTLYLIVMHLLLYSEPSNKILQDKLAKLKFSIDFQDIHSLLNRLKMLHSDNRILNVMTRNYTFRKGMDNDKINEFLVLVQNQEEIKGEVSLLMHSILTGDIYKTDTNKQPKTELVINADELILHMLEDDRSPILDIALAKGHFKRHVNEDDSNVNRIEIDMLQGFNLLDKAVYPAFLEPLYPVPEDEHLITVDWSMYRAIGGIKLIENFEIKSQPLCLRIDEISERKLFKFIFQSESESIDDSPIVEVSKRHEEKQERLHNQALQNLGQDSGDAHEDSEHVETESKKTDKDGTSTLRKKKSANGQNSFSQSSSSDRFNEDKIEEMISRSNKYISINNLKVHPVSMSVSLKLQKGVKRVLNVHDFVLDLPEITVKKRVVSPVELAMLFKTVVIKSLMSHLGSLLHNKLRSRDKSTMNVHQRPMKQLKTYSSFVAIKDLQVDGEAR